MWAALGSGCSNYACAARPGYALVGSTQGVSLWNVAGRQPVSVCLGAGCSQILYDSKRNQAMALASRLRIFSVTAEVDGSGMVKIAQMPLPDRDAALKKTKMLPEIFNFSGDPELDRSSSGKSSLNNSVDHNLKESRRKSINSIDYEESVIDTENEEALLLESSKGLAQMLEMMQKLKVLVFLFLFKNLPFFFLTKHSPAKSAPLPDSLPDDTVLATPIVALDRVEEPTLNDVINLDSETSDEDVVVFTKPREDEENEDVSIVVLQSSGRASRSNSLQRKNNFIGRDCFSSSMHSRDHTKRPTYC